MSNVLTAEEVAVEAEKIGRAAFAAGKCSTPARDAALTPLLRSGHALVALNAWIHGWHDENLNQPLTEVQS